MSAYCGYGRSNYFRVRDTAAFNAALPDGFELVTDRHGRVAVLSHTGRGDWMYYDEDTDTDVDVTDTVVEHLASGEVAVFESIGYEKLRYLNGYATAVNSLGDVVTIDIGDVYQKAADTFGVPRAGITRAMH